MTNLNNDPYSPPPQRPGDVPATGPGEVPVTGHSADLPPAGYPADGSSTQYAGTPDQGYGAAGTAGAYSAGAASGARRVPTEADRHTDRYAEDPRSIGEIASDVLANASTLIRQEVDLAKAELNQTASRAGKGAGLLGGAGVAGLFALLFASLAAWWAIGVLIGTADQPALGWSGLIMTVIYAIVALVLMSMGKGELKRVKGLPKTAETVSKIPNAVTGNEEKN